MDQARYRHEALLYAGEDAFVARVGGFLRAGVEAGDAVLAVVDAPKIKALERALGSDADRVEFADMGSVGRNPGLIIQRWLEFVDGQKPGTTMRGVGEPVGPDRLAPEREECHVHEALLNVALATETPLWLVCPYDTTALTTADIEHAERNHPFVSDGVAANANENHIVIDPFAGTFGDPVPPVREMAYEVSLLSSARAFAMDAALGAGIPRDRAEEFVLAMSEIASNSVQHGGGTGTLRCWREPDRFICEVEDAGRLQAPLVGRIRPEPGGLSGYGLWIAQQLCDLVQVRSDEQRTVVRLHIRLP